MPLMLTSHYSLALFLFALFACPASAGAETPRHRSAFRAVGNQFAFEAGRRTVAVQLDIPVNQWTVNCTRTHAIVWGIDQRKLPMGVPPFNKIYVIDLRRGKPVDHFTRTRGPYGARFSKDQTMAIVDDEVVDLAKGKVVGYIYDMKLDDETCPPFPGKQSG